MRSAHLVLATTLIGAGVAPAYGGIYYYVDAGGSVHYTNVPSDRRYVLLLSEDGDRDGQRRSTGNVPADVTHRGAPYFGLIDEAARRAEVPAALLRAVVAVESAFDPRAVSRKGAQGLMQLRPGTAARYGVRRPFDPADNLRGGASYISDLLRRYDDDMELALAAYNAGEEAVDRYGRTIPPFVETRLYVPAVLDLYRKFLRGVHLAGYPKTLPPPT
jgi:hypothetical protein